ncbi:hypothetical protein DAPPUDRAFT_259448 [Daphnia pulex]|uniref:Uncharacterized protein n=1 Tax=Daphnia pulex TaxID=6669 RepID=E9HH88_DAPPU|nr:hypothetical protein DAPPUDRAFT_263873 [Daphnia pulex]EFX68901.1 hypothetical protein DAPPUDRAFT_259448 [Daphnia pulex]|eukprot:EFX65979.1 hypothetical protein DAPPUDRAFT_263873 [Daphnia pulex]
MPIWWRIHLTPSSMAPTSSKFNKALVTVDHQGVSCFKDAVNVERIYRQLVQPPIIEGPLIPLFFDLFARSNNGDHGSDFDRGSPNPENKGDQNNNNK